MSPKAAEEASYEAKDREPKKYQRATAGSDRWLGQHCGNNHKCKRYHSPGARCELMFVAVVVIILTSFTVMIGGDVFTVGYLTGSQRRPGDREYARPGEFVLHIRAETLLNGIEGARITGV